MATLNAKTIHAAERTVLTGLIDHPEYVFKLACSLSPANFSNSVHASIFAVIIDTMRGIDPPECEIPDAEFVAAFSSAVGKIEEHFLEYQLEEIGAGLTRLLEMKEKALGRPRWGNPTQGELDGITAALHALSQRFPEPRSVQLDREIPF